MNIALHLPDSWVWDFWFADDGERYHLFFLFASRALGDPALRHERCSIGHAVSTDLLRWERVADALVPSAAPAFDDLATWTGSVVRHPDGQWLMFYTGGHRTRRGVVQTIGIASSDDLRTWTKHPHNPVLRADSRWYERLGDSDWQDEAFRDPFVLADPTGDGWHMYLTARANHGPSDQRGVIGHARSTDLYDWQLQPPLSSAGAGFSQLEVIQVVLIGQAPTLLFSCLPSEVTDAHPDLDCGSWWATAPSVLGPFDPAHATPLTDGSLYSARLIQDRRSGTWQQFAFTCNERDRSSFGQIVRRAVAADLV